ncbi:MAG TPA: chemotaxis-specific protein-glutamate methyltransferase CheB [Anaeromyxobacter sp.]|nr:chemotaxis-specific protein-glutamate methyltransferase CheB [Anaeromyxobacter sp.]
MTRGGASPAIRVLLVDDSEAVRAGIGRVLEASCGATLVGVAADGEQALREAQHLRPDLILLDLQMPRMDGFTFLRLLMARQPTPVVVISAQSRRTDVFKALELGALDFVPKPEGDAPIEAVRDALVEKCQLVRALRIENLGPRGPARAAGDAGGEPAGVVAIAASTGGPAAIQRLLASLSGELPLAFLVAQHMPERFTAAFAERLARTTPFVASEAADGDVVAAGRVLVAPGGRHLEARRGPDGVLRAAVLLPAAVPGAKHCPSGDVLFASVARAAGSRACALVLTGMGQDGCAGVRAIKSAGGLTLAESADTAVVYGMPQAAAESGSVDEVLALRALADRIRRFGGGH